MESCCTGRSITRSPLGYVEGRGVIVASLPGSLKSRYARVRDGWTIGSSEAWVTSRLVAFSNKRDASS